MSLTEMMVNLFPLYTKNYCKVYWHLYSYFNFYFALTAILFYFFIRFHLVSHNTGCNIITPMTSQLCLQFNNWLPFKFFHSTKNCSVSLLCSLSVYSFYVALKMFAALANETLAINTTKEIGVSALLLFSSGERKRSVY